MEYCLIGDVYLQSTAGPVSLHAARPIIDIVSKHLTGIWVRRVLAAIALESKKEKTTATANTAKAKGDRNRERIATGICDVLVGLPILSSRSGRATQLPLVARDHLLLRLSSLPGPSRSLRPRQAGYRDLSGSRPTDDQAAFLGFPIVPVFAAWLK